MTKDDSGNNINLVVGPYKPEMTAKRLLKLKNNIYFSVHFVPQRLCVRHFYILKPLQTWRLCVKIFSKAIPISSFDYRKRDCFVTFVPRNGLVVFLVVSPQPPNHPTTWSFWNGQVKIDTFLKARIAKSQNLKSQFQGTPFAIPGILSMKKITIYFSLKDVRYRSLKCLQIQNYNP
jgi:hypothetical protein